VPIDPAEWLITAQHLVTSPDASEADLRRGVSTAYYAVFHELLKMATERFIGTRRDTSYRTLYRAFDHTRMKRMCDDLNVQDLKRSYANAIGLSRPSDDIREFARGFAELQQGRHEADYNPVVAQSKVDSFSLVQLAENTIGAFHRIPQQHQNAILLYMLTEMPKQN
jgi:hypothetical protein